MASERFQRRIERLLDEADEAIARYDWEAVRQAAQAVLAIDPENSDGVTFLAAPIAEACRSITHCSIDGCYMVPWPSCTLDWAAAAAARRH